ncbi:ABC transporter permease subunit [Lachnospiraceae bacterium ZAX-1]
MENGHTFTVDATDKKIPTFTADVAVKRGDTPTIDATNEKISTPFRECMHRFKQNKSAMVALGFILFLCVIAVIAYPIAPYGINEYNYSAVLQPPSSSHIFGTDEFGRDLFSRILCGTYISLSVGLTSVTVGALCGTVLGLLAGYYGGLLDSVIMRICDALFAFPGMVLAIAIVAILGAGMANVVIAVAVFGIPGFARLVRSSTLIAKNNLYVQAARNVGCNPMRILFKHILPSALPNIVIQYSMSIGSSILAAAGLSFLGMGAMPPTPEWGLMLSGGRNYMATSWHITFFPGLVIFLTVLSFNLLGDGLRDALDPKFSQTEG